MIFYQRPHGTQLECCNAASRRRGPLALGPRWISAATKLVGPLRRNCTRLRAEPISARSHSSFPLKPPIVAAGASSRTMKIETLSVDFTDEQKRYLEGFATGLQVSRAGRALGGESAGKASTEPNGPDAAHFKAQDKVIASGKKLADQEKFKREEHPFDAYPRLKQQALANAAPSTADNFRWRYYGLFYVAPTQDSYMCRLRIPNGILKHWQLAGMADLAERYCGPFCHVTTRANLQVREIPPKHTVALIEGIQDLGLCSRGSGADAIVRVFIDLGDRTNRLKARLKYVIDRMGMEKFLAAVEEKRGSAFTRVPPEVFAPRPAFDRMAHIGVHKQKQAGLNWIGVALPLGKVTCEQMRRLAKIAQDFGDGDIRLTVWQNLLISGLPDANVELATAAVRAIGLDVEASQIRAGLIACTGNTGCKFAASNTKLHAAKIGDWCEPRVNIDTPLNIHLTGCHHSCAQHYISDIGLIAAKVPVGEEDDTVEGYHLFAGGGFGPNADIGQEIYHDLKAEDAPKTVEKLLRAYLSHRASPGETFLAFARRHDGERLRRLAEAEVSA